MLQLAFNPGLTLTGFRTTCPSCLNWKINCDDHSSYLFIHFSFYYLSTVRLRVVKNKQKVQTFNSIRVIVVAYESACLQEVAKMVIWLENFWYFGKPVTEKSWSLTRGGCLQEVVTTGGSTGISLERNFTGQNPVAELGNILALGYQTSLHLHIVPRASSTWSLHEFSLLGKCHSHVDRLEDYKQY